jgi:hypothetical protein
LSAKANTNSTPEETLLEKGARIQSRRIIDACNMIEIAKYIPFYILYSYSIDMPVSLNEHVGIGD